MVAALDTPMRGSAAPRQVASGFAMPFGSSRNADGETTDGLLYVFNFENDGGYAIASGDSRVDDVLAVIDTGHYDPVEIAASPGIAMMMDLVEDYYIVMASGFYPPVKDIDLPPRPTYGPWEIFYQAGEIIPVGWGQDTPYNLRHDGYAAGCVATAIAQIMAYYSYPASYTNSPFTYSFDWGKMKQHNKRYYNAYYGNWDYHSYDCESCLPDILSPSQTTHNQIACLFDMLGISQNLNIKYGRLGDPNSNGSEAYITDIKKTFINFGYTTLPSGTTGIVTYSFAKVHASLQLNRPVIIGGKETGKSYGHVWIIDQAVKRKRKVTSSDPRIGTSYQEESNYYLHNNFGYDRFGNGYYAEGVFNLTAGPKEGFPEVTIVDKTGNYTVNLQIIPGIAP